MDWPFVALIVAGSVLMAVRAWPFVAAWRRGKPPEPREDCPDCDRDASGWGTG